MKDLKAAIALRILDSIGVISKEMNDIRNESYLSIHDGSKVYSGRVNYSEKEALVFLYIEINDNDKYMTTFLESDNMEGDVTLCIVSCDNEDVDLNKLIIGNKNRKFREISYLEASKFLNTFEVIRNHMPNWLPNNPKIEQVEYLFKFIDSIDIN